MSHRRFLLPEAVQVSNIDCGPAALKMLLEGFGVPASYGRLREACRTDVDGTSIDGIERVANELGLDAEQAMIPVEHLLLEEAAALPALVVTLTPERLTHFVVVWNCVGPLVQIGDPVRGRRWLPKARFLDEVLRHEAEVPREAFVEWARGAGFTDSLRRRLRQLGGDEALVGAAVASPDWRALAGLDAALRFVEGLVAARAVSRGAEAALLIAQLSADEAARQSLPPEDWSARAGGDEDSLFLRGAVALTVRGVRQHAAPPDSPELRAALAEARPRPLRQASQLLGRTGALAALAGAAALSGASGVVEVALLARLLDPSVAGRVLLPLISVLLGRAALEALCARRGIALGRALHFRFLRAFIDKLPALSDRYFASRPASDMAARAHDAGRLAELPPLLAGTVRLGAELGATAAALVWLAPSSAALVAALFAVALLLPLGAHWLLADRELRWRAHGGTRTYFIEALRGAIPLRAHGSGGALEREHALLLDRWRRSGRSFLDAAAAADALSLAMGVLLLVLLIGRSPPHEAWQLLLFVYLCLQLPVLGRDLLLAARQVPGHRATLLRLLEPLQALEDAAAEMPGPQSEAGVTLTLKNVGVRVAGHTLLSEIDLEVAAGEKVAIVGPSGSGKSSLVGLLLGWHRPAEGALAVDGEPLNAARLSRLRRETAWVDPAAQLWNASLDDNLRFGNRAGADLARALDGAGLAPLAERLGGAALGEGGKSVAGGEAQRVLFGRALAKEGVRLAIFDEPFRGLDRAERRVLLERARAAFASATLLCITHDLAETQGFDRVLVMEGGRLLESGRPSELLARSGSRYRALLDAEERVAQSVWKNPRWRRVRVEGGSCTGDLSAHEGAASEEGAAPPIPKTSAPISGAEWPAARLNEALARLCGKMPQGIPPQSLDGAIDGQRVGRAAAAMGLSAEPLEVRVAEGPALLHGARGLLVAAAPDRFILVALDGAHARQLSPDGAALRGSLDEILRASVAPGPAVALPAALGPRAAEALRGRRLGRARLRHAWLLRDAELPSLVRALGARRSPLKLVGFLAGQLLRVGCLVGSYAVVGRAALDGTSGGARTIAAWALLLLLALGAESLTRWLAGGLLLDVGDALKRRFIAYALGADTDALAGDGVGRVRGRAMAAEAVETLAREGALSGVAALVELGAAAALLAFTRAPLPMGAALAGAVLLGLLLGRRRLSALRRAAAAGLEVTHRLIEQLIGHRTRLAQLPRDRWAADGPALEPAVAAAAAAGRAQLWLEVLPERLFVVTAGVLVARAPFVSPAATALMLGGLLLGRHALGTLTRALSQLLKARVAGETLRPLFARPHHAPLVDAPVQPGAPLLDARDLEFRHAGSASPALEHCTLAIAENERVLIEGPSGGGKSTLAALLSGLRAPSAGSLYLGGRAPGALGVGEWRRRVIAVPQFHQNHVFSESLAFNLLGGRAWPPSSEDLAEAERICAALGLDAVLARMPSGLMEIVGETGWQLSHGEQARLFVARALLQQPDLLIIDESFGALDPETLELAMEQVLARARTLVVIAHP
jgi:ATP-binding cassette subfamily B protein